MICTVVAFTAMSKAVKIIIPPVVTFILFFVIIILECLLCATNASHTSFLDFTATLFVGNRDTEREVTGSSQRARKRQRWVLNPGLSGPRLAVFLHTQPCYVPGRRAEVRQASSLWGQTHWPLHTPTYPHCTRNLETQAALPVSHLHRPQNSPVFLADRNLEARAPPSLRGAPARPPRGCLHPDARSGLCMAHKAPPAKQGHRVGGPQPRLGIWGWECSRA